MSHSDDTLSILLIDDDPAILRSLENFLTPRGFGVHAADSGRAGLARLDERQFDIVITDVKMPGMDGLEVLREVRHRSPETAVIIITGYKESEQAFRAIREGAFDFFTKPLDVQELKASLERTIRFQKLHHDKGLAEERLGQIDEATRARYGMSSIVGVSPATEALKKDIRDVCDSDTTTVLIFGETGTGKELVARAIHVEGARSSGSFVAVDCSAVPATLVESEFYGHGKGAFTDAHSAHKGYFEQADGGTLFLDEIGDMDLAMQARLLRVLEERYVRRIGGAREISVDVRVISATNRDLELAVTEGRFREELYYRLNTFCVQVPALRSRVEDIPVLADHFLGRFARDLRKQIAGFTPEASDSLRSYPFPGNVRELRNVVEHAVISCSADRIAVEDLHLPVPNDASPAPPESSTHSASDTPQPQARTLSGEPDLTIAGFEEDLIREALLRSGGNRTQAARVLGISRKQLLTRIRKYGL